MVLHGHLYRAERRQVPQAFFDGHIERGPGISKRPDKQVGKHHHQDVSPGALLSLDIHGPHFEKVGLARAKCPLNRCEIFIPVVDDLCVRCLPGKVGLDDVATIKEGGFLERLLIDREAQRSFRYA